jgi:hypothetical protein
MRIPLNVCSSGILFYIFCIIINPKTGKVMRRTIKIENIKTEEFS